MAPATFILTSSPFVLNQITLGSFIPNIRQPHQDGKRPYTVKASEYSVQPDDAFNGLINISSRSFLNLFATRFATFSFQHDKSSMLRITAQRGRIYSLDNPTSLFEEMVFGQETGEDMKEWFERCKRQKIQPRFVTGYRTFIDGHISRGQHLTADTAGGSTIPISTAQGDLSGTADIEVQAGHRTNTDMKGDAQAPGERIYAICYRKINISSHQGKVEALLEQKNKWEPFAAMRGAVDEEYFQADLSDNDDVERCDMYEVDPGGKEVHIGVLSE